MPDHVHVLVSLSRGMLDEEALQILKGGSAYYFFRFHERARLRYPRDHLWARGGFAVTVGYNEYSKTEKYILEQAKHHAFAY